MFLRLTELGDGTEDTRRRATLEELASESAAGTERTEVVLDTLVAARLADREPVPTSFPTVRPLGD